MKAFYLGCLSLYLRLESSREREKAKIRTAARGKTGWGGQAVRHCGAERVLGKEEQGQVFSSQKAGSVQAQ